MGLFSLFSKSAALTPAQKMGRALMKELENYQSTIDVPKCLDLISQGADVSDANALRLAVRNDPDGKIVQALVGAGCPLNETFDEERQTALHLCLADNKFEKAEIIVRGGASLTVMNRKGRTAQEELEKWVEGNQGWDHHKKAIAQAQEFLSLLDTIKKPPASTITEVTTIPELKKTPFQPGGQGSAP